MDVIITAIGEFIWASSCAVINFCLSSGVSVIAVFVSFLCAILASAFYKYTTSREDMSLNYSMCPFLSQTNDDPPKPVTTTSTTTAAAAYSVTTDDTSNNVKDIESLTEIEIALEENTDENTNETTNETTNGTTTEETTSNGLLIETIEGSEEEIQKQQIANIYRLLNDQNLINNWSSTDFIDQLKMYGLHTYDEDEPESS